MYVVRSANKFSQISVNIWAINAKHRHRKGRANTLFVIGRNIDGSMIDLRRFYLIISRPDRESSLIKDPSKVKGSYLLNLKLREKEEDYTSFNLSITLVSEVMHTRLKLVQQ